MDLFAPALRPDAFQSSGIRISPVMGDNMEPTLRPHSDYVVCRPVSAYEGEGLYLADFAGYGFPQVHRVLSDLSGGLKLANDNPHYRDCSVSREKFEAAVLAKVVADVKVRDHRSLAELAGA